MTVENILFPWDEQWLSDKDPNLESELKKIG